jgi:hypothetical protein
MTQHIATLEKVAVARFLEDQIFWEFVAGVADVQASNENAG